MKFKLIALFCSIILAQENLIAKIYSAKSNTDLSFCLSEAEFLENEKNTQFWQAVISYIDKFPNSGFSNSAVEFIIKEDLAMELNNVLQTTRSLTISELESISKKSNCAKVIPPKNRVCSICSWLRS